MAGRSRRKKSESVTAGPGATADAAPCYIGAACESAAVGSSAVRGPSVPKGARGCFVCGEPTEGLIQLNLIEYLEETYGNRLRKQRFVETTQRSYCTEHAEEAMAAVVGVLQRSFSRDTYHGCAICGERTRGRIQVWRRKILEEKTGGGRRQRTVETLCYGYCTEHAVEVHEAARVEAGMGVNGSAASHGRDGLAAARHRRDSNRNQGVVK